jgi:hypothetical protein
MRWQLIFAIVVLVTFSAGCRNTEKCVVAEANSTVTSKSPVPKKVYVPEYYRYHNGRYTFVKGRYRPVIAKKAQHKRTLRGYTSHPDYTSIR